RVADDGALVPGVARLGRRADDDLAAGHALADVVVALAVEQHAHARREERAEALPGAALEAQRQRAVGQPGLAVARADLARQRRANGPVDVGERVGQLDRRAALDRRAGVLEQA